MLEPAVASPLLLPFDGSLKRSDVRTRFSQPVDKDNCRKRLREVQEELDEQQRRLAAGQHQSVLLVFQALDAAGKDSTIRAVFSGLDPAGIKVSSFKQPSKRELRHDFLWRLQQRLPERGKIGIFNRSHYEEVLAVRVHPEFLKAQYPGGVPEDLEQLWQQRYESICAWERHLAQSATLVLKFWLNVSVEEQHRRFLSRCTNPRKQWKFNPEDVSETAFRDEYQRAFIDLVNATSRPWAPWFCIPADDKPMMRLAVAEIVRDALNGLKLDWPQPDVAAKQEIDRYLGT